MLVGSRAAACCAIAAALQATGPVATPSVERAVPIAPVPTAIVGEPSAPPAGFVRIPANTPVDFEIVDQQSSKTSKIDDMFAIRLVDPVTVNGTAVLSVGTMGRGQIVHAAKARALGKAGELILAARFLSCGDAHIALRGFHLGQSGKNKATELTVAIATIGFVAAPLLFVSGGESIIPAGTHASARLSMAVDVLTQPDAPCTALPVAALAPAAVLAPAKP